MAIATFPSLVFLLCAASSVACTTLLFRSFRRTRVPLLLWSGLCFVGLSVSNLTLFLDIVVLPAIDLILLRYGAALAGLAVLIYGFIWEID